MYIQTADDKLEQINEWDEINQPIKRLIYSTTKEHDIVMEGFESYLKLKENVYGVNVKIDMISKVLLMGKHGDTVAVITLDYQNGKITKEIKAFGEEYNGKAINQKFWKTGIRGTPSIIMNNVVL